MSYHTRTVCGRGFRLPPSTFRLPYRLPLYNFSPFLNVFPAKSLFPLAGLYLHIPFCKQACHYCNFHFSTSLQRREEMVDALIRELAARRDYLPHDQLETVYFGGGTPSLLTDEELARLFTAIGRHFQIAPDAEITLEANPDDLSRDRLQALYNSPINRLSIGVQSFFAEDLLFMNRAHNAAEAHRCIEDALAVGFQNLTVDLIYGSPTTSDEHWAANVRTLLDYGIPHLSCYALTVEPKTALDAFIRKGKVPPPAEEQAARQFEYLIATLTAAGYEHYEISNFARPGYYARHNTNYWRGTPYLGLGPSAHSYDGQSRQWNVANNAKYLRYLAEEPSDWDIKTLEGQLYEREVLGPADRYNEYVMTALRTQWGVDLELLSTAHQPFLEHFHMQVLPYLAGGHVTSTPTGYRLTPTGKLLADRIASDLFFA